ncbi:hypothetical protein FRB96_009689 [Tulasnella sp. 330]|nr:hypothetical protein FRB96_009689 [Tulasnella sp. 330]
MNAPRAIIILSIFAAGSTMGMPLNHNAGSTSQFSRRDNPELNSKQQQWAYQMRNLNNGYRSSIASLDSEGQARVEKQAGRLEEEIARDEHMLYTPSTGTGVFDQIDISAQDDNVKKLSLDRVQLERLEYLQRRVADEIARQQRGHHFSKRSLNSQQLEFAQAARTEVQQWQAEMCGIGQSYLSFITSYFHGQLMEGLIRPHRENLDSHGQAKELKKVQEFVKSLAKREKKPYVETTGMDIFNQANELLEDDNFGGVALKYLKKHHRLAHEEKSVNNKIRFEEKHHSVAKRSEPITEEDDTSELNTAQQDYAIATRQEVAEWRAQIANLDGYAQEKELKKVQGFVKSLAKREGEQYIPSPGMEIFDEADRLLQNEYVEKLAPKYLKKHHRLDHQSKEVYKEVTKQQKHHSLPEGFAG